MIVHIKDTNGLVLFHGEYASFATAMEEAVMSGADLSGADLSGANLYGADLPGANLSGADLSGANLPRANLPRADLYGANLSGANLSGANLPRADLYGANLSRANLSRASLPRADLYGANLSGADLSGANLSGANLDPRRSNPLLDLYIQKGSIRKFKLVNGGGEGPIKGGIKYEIGKSYSVENFESDPSKDCGAGINLATLDWCLREWREGYKILIAEHTAKDIVAIPWFSDGKYRVKRCKIISEYEL